MSERLSHWLGVREGVSWQVAGVYVLGPMKTNGAAGDGGMGINQ